MHCGKLDKLDKYYLNTSQTLYTYILNVNANIIFITIKQINLNLHIR